MEVELSFMQEEDGESTTFGVFSMLCRVGLDSLTLVFGIV